MTTGRVVIGGSTGFMGQYLRHRYREQGREVITISRSGADLSWDDAADGFLLDGYPRNRTQAATLEEILGRLGVDLDTVLELTADTDELTQRLKHRAETEGRDDDADESVIRRRLELFENETRPMIDEYKTRGLVKQVNGLGSVDEVNGRIMEALNS